MPRWELLARDDAGQLISQALTAIAGEAEGQSLKAQADAQRARTGQ